MSYVILVRNPQRGGVFAIEDGDGEHTTIALYETEAEAEAEARNIPVCEAWPYVIVEAP